TTAPARSPTKMRPAYVSGGMSAFRRACFQTTPDSRRPFARAVTTYSWPRVSSIAERTSRMIPATVNHPSVIEGSTRCAGPPAPLERIPEVTEHSVAEIDRVLHRERSIEPEDARHRLAVVLGGPCVEQDVERVPGEPRHDERDHRQQPQRHQRLENAREKKASHARPAASAHRAGTTHSTWGKPR